MRVLYLSPCRGRGRGVLGVRGMVECSGEGAEEEEEERGVRFLVGGGFFRKESREGRDMGVLAAAVYRRRSGRLRVMDAMCGCGVRALRYLAQANADFVWANDANEDISSTILSNLSNIPTSNWFLSHQDANRLLCHRYLLDDYYDLIDIDSFGSSSSFFASSLSAIRHDGLLYLTSTDGFSSGGHRPLNALTSYGAFIRPMPYANEIGLRMLIGGAVREAATRNMNAKPVFSLYSYHGPVFRVMLQVARGKPLKNRHYGFIGYCRICGDSHAFSWENMGQMFCPCSERKDKLGSLVVSGPLWIGPLHSGIEIREMLELAEEWGWTMKEKCSSTGKNADLKKLLTIMLEESTPGLPSGYIKLDEIARRGKINSPRRDVLIDNLKKIQHAHLAFTHNLHNFFFPKPLKLLHTFCWFPKLQIEILRALPVRCWDIQPVKANLMELNNMVRVPCTSASAKPRRVYLILDETLISKTLKAN